MAESFLQYQTSNYGPARRSRQGAPAPQPVAGTPVMPNGQPIAAAPTQPQAPAPAPTNPQQPAAPAVQPGQVNGEGIYAPGSVPTATYQQQNIPQFRAPDSGNINQQLQQMIGGILGNPQTMSPQMMSQMKGANRDQGALLAKQNIGDQMSAMAARGIDPNSAYAQSMKRSVMGDLGSNILSNNRAIDIQGAQQNRQDMLQALSAGNSYMNDNLGRATQGYGAQLSGAQAMGNEQSKYLDSLYNQFNAGLQGNSLASQSTLGAIGNRLQSQSLANDMSKFGQTYDLQNRQFDWSKVMDDRNFGLASGAQSSANDHWSDEMAFNYQKYNDSQQNNLFNFLMGGGVQ